MSMIPRDQQAFLDIVINEGLGNVRRSMEETLVAARAHLIVAASEIRPAEYPGPIIASATEAHRPPKVG